MASKSALNQFLEMLRNHNALFVGDTGLREAYEAFLTKHKAARTTPTPGQLVYQAELESLFPVAKKVD